MNCKSINDGDEKQKKIDFKQRRENLSNKLKGRSGLKIFEGRRW